MTEAIGNFANTVGSAAGTEWVVSDHPERRARPRDGHHSVRYQKGWSFTRELKLSIVMPVYNEQATVQWAIQNLLSLELPCPLELVVVDDGSTDRTQFILAEFDDPRLTVFRHPQNLGKGAAMRTGIAVATGSHMLPCDADLEYLPTDIPKLLTPITAGISDVVYGTRLFGQNTVYQSYRYAIGNRATTFAANVLFDSALSDLHSCYKLVPLDLLRQLPLTESGFGFDTEITAALLRRGVRPFEVPISYHSRGHNEGKKITWKDGVRCVRILARVRLRAQPPVQARISSNGVALPVGRQDAQPLPAVPGVLTLPTVPGVRALARWSAATDPPPAGGARPDTDRVSS